MALPFSTKTEQVTRLERNYAAYAVTNENIGNLLAKKLPPTDC